MGVNRENEPLSGTGPDNRLFDKSLMTIVRGTNQTPTTMKKLEYMEIGYTFLQE